MTLKLVASYLEAFKYNQQDKLTDALSQAVNDLDVDLNTENAIAHEKVSVLPVSQKILEGDFDSEHYSRGYNSGIYDGATACRNKK